MIRVTTESGAVYWIDGMKVLRDGPGINYATVPDNQWITYKHILPLVVGRSAVFWDTREQGRITTPVVSIEVV